MLGLWRKKLEERYKIIDPAGKYEAISLNDFPKTPTTLYKRYIRIKNLSTGNIKTKRIRGLTGPIVFVDDLEFNKPGLVVKIFEHNEGKVLNRTKIIRKWRFPN